MSQDGRNEVHDFRLAVERAINSTLVVGTATVGQNLVFGSGGFEWVTPSGTSSSAVTAVEIDLGTVPVKSKSLTVTAAACEPTFNVLVSPSADPATGRGSDDGLWDGLILSAVAGTGEFTLHVLAVPGPVSGKRMVNYQFGT